MSSVFVQEWDGLPEDDQHHRGDDRVEECRDHRDLCGQQLRDRVLDDEATNQGYEEGRLDIR